ncbi:MAG TPA: choice-of-anchor D domain-containing protein [Acidimicrobiales bacterium]|nr:choice-of-anchor D domain-containing protein [Acidimicrobiales bacterium]
MLSAAASMMTLGLAIPTLVIIPSANADTLQMSSDNLETGWYPNEPQLAPSAVTGGDFGQLFNTLLTGQVYAQPLVAQPIVLAVTEKDYAYGLNSSTGAIVWSRNFGTPADPLAQIGCGDIGANMGITGTPVIDPATDNAYFVAATGTGTSGATQYFMDAVNVQTGTTPTGWPAGGVPIQGAADNDPGTVFNGQWQTQRPGLVLVNGVVYAAFGSQCDYGSWNGWLVGVSESSASITTIWASETGLGGGGRAGIWQSGSAPVVDSQGNIYFSTGNGTLPSPGPGTKTSVTNLGEAVVKLSTTGGKLHLADWFVPDNAATLNAYDGDLGSGGLVALPPSMGSTQEPNVLLQVGKEGVLYALNMNALGGYQQGPSASDAVPFETSPSGGVWSKPAAWPGDGGYVYFPTAGSVSSTYPNTSGGSLNAYKRVVTESGAVTFELVGSTSNSGSPFPFGSGKPIVTSNGTTSGSSLLWITQISRTSGVPSELQAYDPIPQNPGPNGTLTEVWHASIGTATKYSEPAVDNGNIYVGTKNGTSDGALIGFGLLPTAIPALTGDNVDFSPTIVSQSITATATFTATAPTNISSFTATGSAFTLGTSIPSLPATLSEGQSITVPVTFTPDAAGGLSGTLTANATGGPTAVVSLSGQGLSATTPIKASPASVDFSSQPIGGTSVSQLVTFTNVSLNPVVITGFTPPVLPFSVATPPVASGTTVTLNPGDSSSFAVTFAPPGSSGNFDHVFGGVVTLITNAGDFGVPLSGSAAPPAQINIDPTVLSFGSVQVGSTASLTFNVGNLGSEPLTITTSTPPATNGFSALTSLPSSFAADTSVQEAVQFAPASTGSVSSTWIIEGNDGSGVQTVTLTGTGVAAPPPSPPPPSSGGSSNSPPPSVQSTLTITTLSGSVGTALALSTSGDTGGGAVTFSVSNGSAAGCVISGSSLTVTSAGTCVVTATMAANGTSSAISSPATTITFAPKISTASPVAVAVRYSATSYELSAEAKKTLRALASRLVAGASVTITGFAKGDAVLAKSRARAVARYLASLVKLKVTLKSVTYVSLNRATVYSANR